MKPISGLPSLEFSEAKAHLSDVMSEVVREHQPRLISRYREKETMILLNTEDVATWLQNYHFEPTIIISNGEVTAQLPRFGLLGFGASVDEALDDLLTELRAYVQRFFEQASFYMQSERREHLPWLLRFALTPPDKQHQVLVSIRTEMRVDSR